MASAPKTTSAEEKKFNQKAAREPLKLVVILPKNFSSEGLKELKNIFERFAGDKSVFFQVKQGEKWQTVVADYKVNITSELIKEIKSKFEDEVVLRY